MYCTCETSSPNPINQLGSASAPEGCVVLNTEPDVLYEEGGVLVAFPLQVSIFAGALT